MIDTLVLKRFEALIRARGGLCLRAQEAPALQKMLHERQTALRLPSPESYLDWLAAPTPAADEEWAQLWRKLTNQESYFFRDAEQLGVISDHIWPELARSNRDSRSLRIWSAGCSTGEEPFTLAMMLEERPEFAPWRLDILGTDLSEAALERARRGLYGEWSFRALSEARRTRFFTPRGKEWEVAPHLRQTVSFAPNNLFSDPFPTPAGPIRDFDLIVCRNVFIYFDRAAVAQVLQKLSASLRPGGFLVCGHAELHDVPLGDLQIRAFPQSVIYQRALAPQNQAKSPLATSHQNPKLAAPRPEFPPPIRAASPAARPVSVLSTTPRPSALAKPAANAVAAGVRATDASAAVVRVSGAGAGASNASVTDASVGVLSGASTASASASVASASDAAENLERARTELRAGRAAAGMKMVESLLESQPELAAREQVAGWCLLAQAQADAGLLDLAQSSCERALQLAPMTALPYLVLARIAEERGAGEAAKSLLKKVMYLSPDSVWAPLELSAIYQHEGDVARAAQMQRAALALLQDLADEAPVPAEEHALEMPARVGDLKRQLRAELEAAPANR